jgi:molybdopterin molybdotransferase
MRFEQIAVLDWSAAGAPKRGKDSIWLGVTNGDGTRVANIPTRVEAEETLKTLFDRPTLIGIDFAFAPPRGLTERITGTQDPRALWAWLSDRVSDGARNQTNYRDAAAEMNRHFSGDGPFWGNGLKADIPDLPRKKPPLPEGLVEHRATDRIVQRDGFSPKPIWQLAGAGAVGAQSLTGMPMLHRLRKLGAAVWPFDPLGPVTVAEVYPSILGQVISDQIGITDEIQVRLLSQALWSLNTAGGLDALLAQGDPIEGTILGQGASDRLVQAFRIE